MGYNIKRTEDKGPKRVDLRIGVIDVAGVALRAILCAQVIEAPGGRAFWLLKYWNCGMISTTAWCRICGW